MRSIKGHGEMKNYILVGILILVIIAVSGCIGNYGYADINKNLSGFNQIIISGGGPNNIIITQGNTESVEVVAGKSAVKDIKAEVTNKKLYLKSPHPVTYYITVKDINSIEMMGPGPGQMQATNLKLNDLTIYMNNGACNLTNLTANNFIFNSNGSDIYAADIASSKLTINTDGLVFCNITNLNVNDLLINGNGNSGFYIAGKAANQKVTVNKVYNATNLASKTASISINGPGSATVRVRSFTCHY